MAVQAAPSNVTGKADSATLDVLRALAVLYVLFSHVCKELIPPAAFGRFAILTLGKVGVYFFFVHTSLVLLLSLQRRIAGKGRLPLFVSFMLRRVFRIYPLSVVVVATVHLLVALAVLNGPRPSIAMTSTNLLLVQNIFGQDSLPGALWSLPFEVQMYLFLPWLFLLVERRLLNVARLLIVWGAWSIGVFALAAAHLRYDLIRFVPCFLPGIMAYVLWTRPRRVPFFVLPIMLGVLGSVVPILTGYGMRETLLSWPTCLMLGLTLPFVTEVQSPVIRATAHTIAKYSYSIYLVHQPCAEYFLGSRTSWPIPLRLVAFTLAVVGLSYLGYHVIEAPGIRLGSRLAGPRSAARRLPSPEAP